MDDPDLIVIGGGAAGLTAAEDARRRGARTVLVQDGPVGGDCTFTGCVPSKTLLAVAAEGASFAEAMASVRAAVSRIAASDDAAMERAGVDVVRGRARLRSATEVEVEVGTEGGGESEEESRRLRARRIIVATGSSPAIPPIAGLGDVGLLTNESLFDLDDLPRRLMVLGGGAIGCEMAQAFARLGSAVTVIEAMPRLLPREEPEASEVVAEALRSDGAKLLTGETVARAEAGAGGTAAAGSGSNDGDPAPADGGHQASRAGGVRLHLASGAVAEADRVLVAVGRRPSTSDLGLAEVGVELDDRGHVRTSAALATTVPGIWAVGDVTGRLPFTHAAVRMAYVAVHNALGSPVRRRLRPRQFDPTPIPRVTFTDPEVGRVGMTEAEAADHGGRVAYLPLEDVDRAITAGRTQGFVKLVAGPRRMLGNAGGGRILGATVVAPTGGELIHEPALAMHTGMFAGRLAQATHAYPTWSTAIQQAAAQFFREQDGRTARPARR